MMKPTLLAILLASTSSVAVQANALAQTNNQRSSSAFKPSIEMHLEVLDQFQKSAPSSQPTPQPATQANPSALSRASTTHTLPMLPGVATPTALNQQLPPSRYVQQALPNTLPRHSNVAIPYKGVDLPRGADGRILPPMPPSARFTAHHQAPIAAEVPTQKPKKTGWVGDVKNYVTDMFRDDEPQQASSEIPVETSEPSATLTTPVATPTEQAQKPDTVPEPSPQALPALPPVNTQAEQLPSLLDTPKPQAADKQAVPAEQAPPALAQQEERMPVPAPVEPRPAPQALVKAPEPQPKPLPVLKSQTPPPAKPEHVKEVTTTVDPKPEAPAAPKGNAAAYDGLELVEGIHGGAPMDGFMSGYASPDVPMDAPPPPPPPPAHRTPPAEHIALPKPKLAEGEELLGHVGEDTLPSTGLKDPFEDGAVSYAEAKPAPLTEVPSAPPPPPPHDEMLNTPQTARGAHALNEPPPAVMPPPPPPATVAEAAHSPPPAPVPAPAAEPPPQLLADQSQEALPTVAPVPTQAAAPASSQAEESGSWMERLKNKVTGYFKDEEANPTPAPKIEQPDMRLAEMQPPPPAKLPEGVSPVEATPPGLPSLTKLTGDPEVMKQAEAQKVVSGDVPPPPPQAPEPPVALAEAIPPPPPPVVNNSAPVLPAVTEKKIEAKKPDKAIEVVKAAPKPVHKEEAKKPEKKVEKTAEIQPKAKPVEAPIPEKPVTSKDGADANTTPAADVATTSTTEESKGKPVELKRDEPVVASASPADVPAVAPKSDAAALSIRFEPKSKELPPGAKDQLKPIVEALKASPNARVFLKGFSSEADENEARPYSLSRMLKVRVALIQLGADELRINVVPSASSKSSEDRVDIAVKNSAGS